MSRTPYEHHSQYDAASMQATLRRVVTNSEHQIELPSMLRVYEDERFREYIREAKQVKNFFIN